jgi:hypothetical protein
VLFRPRTIEENCTIHNYNVVPTDKGYVVSGNYQSGLSMVDLRTRPTRSSGFADPAPLTPAQPGGDWSAYWCNGLMYESDTTAGCSSGT